MRSILPFRRSSNLPATPPDLQGEAALRDACGRWCPVSSEAAVAWLEAADHAELHSHASACPPCAAELALVAHFVESLGVTNTDLEWVTSRLEPASRFGAGSRTNLRSWVAAAAATIAVAFALPLWDRPPQLPEPPALDVLRSASLTLELEAQPDGAQLVRWHSASGADRYRITMTSLERKVFEVETKELETTLPSANEPGQLLIEALDARGRVVARGSVEIPRQR